MRLTKTGICAVLIVLVYNPCWARNIAVLQVTTHLDRLTVVPVSISLDDITFLSAERLSLVAVEGKNKVGVPFQVYNGESRTLNFLLPPGGKNRSYRFELAEVKLRPEYAALTQSFNNGLVTIARDRGPLLSYQYGVKPAPKGVPPAYGRSGFIHPLYSPKGQILTRIQPEDHYHHYGIWNPWTHVLFENREIDFWNLGGKQGTVRFAGLLSSTSGPVFSEFSVLHEHVAFIDKHEKVVLNETQTIRVYYPQNNDYYIMDMRIALNTASASPVTLLEHRYGGFGWRATGQWHKDNSEVLSSEGKTRENVDNTTGRWFYIQGEVDDDYAGALVMSYPTNFNHPEPMRVWPAGYDDRDDVFAGFSPTKNKDWLIEPGKHYVRKYRFIVYNGKMNSTKAENGWRNFTGFPQIAVKRNAAGE